MFQATQANASRYRLMLRQMAESAFVLDVLKVAETMKSKRGL